LNNRIPASQTSQREKDDFRRSLVSATGTHFGKSNVLSQNARWSLLQDAGVVTYALWPEQKKIDEAKKAKKDERTQDQLKVLAQYNLLTNSYDLMRTASLSQSMWDMLELVNAKARKFWIYSQPAVKAASKRAHKAKTIFDLDSALKHVDFSNYENPISTTFLKAIQTGVDETLLQECFQAILNGKLSPSGAPSWLKTQKDIIALRSCIAHHFKADDNSIDCLRSLLGTQFTEGWLTTFAQTKPKLVDKYIAEQKKRVKEAQKKRLGKRKRGKEEVGEGESKEGDGGDVVLNLKVEHEFYEQLWLQLDQDLRVQCEQWYQRQKNIRKKPVSRLEAVPSPTEEAVARDTKYNVQMALWAQSKESDDGYNMHPRLVVSLHGPEADLTVSPGQNSLSHVLYNSLQPLLKEDMYEQYYFQDFLKFYKSQSKVKAVFKYANLNAPWGWEVDHWDKEGWTNLMYAKCLRNLVGKFSIHHSFFLPSHQVHYFLFALCRNRSSGVRRKEQTVSD